MLCVDVDVLCDQSVVSFLHFIFENKQKQKKKRKKRLHHNNLTDNHNPSQHKKTKTKQQQKANKNKNDKTYANTPMDAFIVGNPKFN